MDLETWFKIHTMTNFSTVETASLKTIQTLEFFMISVIPLKMGK